MNQYFVLLSGENINLAISETQSLIELLDYSVHVTCTGRFLRLTSSGNPTKFLLDRAVLIKKAGSIISVFKINDRIRDIDSSIFQKHIQPNQTFSVQSISLLPERRKEYRANLIRKLGEIIKVSTGCSVNLTNPDVQFIIFLLDDELVLCKSNESILLSNLKSRSPGKTPFFHPSMMNAKLARVMCNLAGIMPNELVLDPFCGGAGILTEASVLGAYCIGIDINWALLRGAYENLSNLPIEKFTVLQSDSRTFPFVDRVFDAIVTDPPYGRASSTRGFDKESLIHETLAIAKNGLRDGGHICISGSTDLGISEIIRSIGFNILSQNQVYVHNTLTREIVSASN